MAVRAQQAPPRSTPDQRSVSRSLISASLTLAATIAFLIALIATAVIGYGLFYRDQVYPGVQSIGVEIGGVTSTQAVAALDERTDGYRATELTFVFEDKTFTTTPEELGVTFDNERTVNQAYEYGRSGNWWNDSWDWFDSLVDGHDVGVYPVIDEAQFEAYLRSIASEIAVHPREPAFQLSDTGDLQITPAVDGRGIDMATTTRDLRSELTSLGNGPITISTVELEPDYTEEFLEPLGQRISGIISEDFVIERGDYRWVLDVQRLDSLLNVSIDSENGTTDLSIDNDRLERLIGNLAESASAEGRDARVFWDGDSFEVVESRPGWQIDVENSVELVADAILSGQHYAELPVIDYPASITTETAEEAAAFGNQIAASRFELFWDEGETDIGGTVVAAAISFEHDSEAGEIIPQTNVDDLELFLTSITGSVDIKPVNANLRYVNGEIEVLSDEESGREMDRRASAESIAEAIANGETRAEIVVNPAEPEVTAAMAGEIEIREMLSFGETYYGGSAANRAHNVELATQRANGAMVPPGGTYSFVESIGGEISLDVGYEQGFGIVATDGGVSTVPSVGGGVCQVSTTIFQAAFWAGMPMVERNWHLYWMPLYGQQPSGMTGLDATVDTSAGLDFKFRNTTDDWIAIVATADGNANRFEIWGTDPGWDIDTEGPNITNRVPAPSGMEYEESDALPAGYRSQVETAHDGFDVEIKRWVRNSDGEVIDELVLDSKYQPASNRTLIGTGN